MAKNKKASEEKTKGLTADKLKAIEDYPTAQDITVDGITWFKCAKIYGDWIMSKQQVRKS